MKKSVILLASAILLVSCDIPAGGNKGRLKKTDDVVRYDDPNAPKGTYQPTVDTVKAVQQVVSDSVKHSTSVDESSASPTASKTEH